MIFRIIFFLALLYPFVGFLGREIEYIWKEVERDKKLHAIAGGVIFIGLFLLTHNIVVSMIVVFLCALAKEVYDRLFRRHKFDMEDIQATVYGGIYGLLLIVFYLFIRDFWTMK